VPRRKKVIGVVSGCLSVIEFRLLHDSQITQEVVRKYVYIASISRYFFTSVIKTVQVCLFCYRITCSHSPRQNSGVCRRVARSFLFPVDTSQCPVLLPIVSQLFP